MADPWAVVAEKPLDPWGVVSEAPIKSQPAAKPRGIGGYIADEVGGAVSGAVNRLKNDFTEGVAATKERIQHPQPATPQNAFMGMADSLKRTGGMIVDAVNVPLSPAAGAVHGAVVKPYGAAASALTGGAYPAARAESDMNTALMAAMPGRGGGVPVPKPRPIADNVAAFEKAGVRPTLAAAAGKGAAATAKAVAENPIAGVRVRGQLAASLDDTAQAASRTAGKYGQPASRGAAGEAVQEGVKGFNDRFKGRSEKLYDSAFTDIEAGQQAAVTASQKVAALRNGQMANFQATPAPVVEPAATGALLQQMGGRVNASPLSQIITDPRLAKIAGALEEGKRDLRFGDLRALRTWVREAKGNETLRQGIDQASLGRLEGALTQDITGNADRLAGPQAARRLRQADTFYRLGSQRIEGALQNFVGKGSAAPKAGESTYDLIIRAAGDRGGADTSRLLALKKSLQPHEWGDVAATTIDRMGLPTPGAADAGPFSVSRFSTNYASLSDQGKSLLFGAGELRKELENLNRVVGMQKGVERASNASKTMVSGQTLATGAGLLNPHTTLPTAGFLGGMALTGEAMANPLFVRWLTRSARAAQQGPKQLNAVQRQLQVAAKTNVVLLPLYQHTTRLLEAPKAAISVAAEPEQTPPQ